MTEQFIERFTYLGVFLTLLAGGLGIPIPEEVPIVASAALARKGLIRWWLALPLCLVAVGGCQVARQTASLPTQMVSAVVPGAQRGQLDPALLQAEMETALRVVRELFFPEIDRVIDGILQSMDENGIPRIRIEIPKAFGGSGEPALDWVICDYPVILYSLVKMGVRDNKIRKSLKTLAGMVQDSGCHCRGSIPKFHGPGPKEGFCPYATVLALKALTEEPDFRKTFGMLKHKIRLSGDFDAPLPAEILKDFGAEE